MSNVNKLIQQLANFQTRAAARQELAMLGKEAVPALIAALKNPVEGVRWSAAKTLGDLGDPSAVDPLIEALDNANLATTAAESLQQITGKDLGLDAQTWRHWRQTGEEPPRALSADSLARGLGEEIVIAGNLSDEEVVRHLLEGSPRITRRDRNGVVELTLPLEGGRKQTLALMFNYTDNDGRKLISIYTECGPAHPTKYDTVFRYNLTLPYGNVIVRDMEGKPTFVMVYTAPRETMDIAVLRRAMLAIAKQADALEYELTRKDII